MRGVLMTKRKEALKRKAPEEVDDLRQVVQRMMRDNKLRTNRGLREICKMRSEIYRISSSI